MSGMPVRTPTDKATRWAAAAGAAGGGGGGGEEEGHACAGGGGGVGVTMLGGDVDTGRIEFVGGAEVRAVQQQILDDRHVCSIGTATEGKN